MKRIRQTEYDSIDKLRQKGKKTQGQPSIDELSIYVYISNPKTIDILNQKGIKSLFKIQQNTYFDIYKGFDMLAKDRTGSGKTLAYSLPIIQRFRNTKRFNDSKYTKMLVIVPTRQLAVQVASEIKSLKHHQKQYQVALAYGGVNTSQQKLKLQFGADFLVATPGRLLYFIENDSVKFQDLSVICLDQADQMLKMGFKDDIDKILRLIKSKSNGIYQTLLFSATLPEQIVNISKNYLKLGHKVIDMIPATQNLCSTTIRHYKIQTTKREKVNVIIKLLNEFVYKNGLCIIFCETKKQTIILQNQLTKIIKQRIQILSGEVSQQKRLKTFASMKNGQIRFIVATNVAARGLDIPNVQMVIQFSPPKQSEHYIHRAGRTGRAGKQGLCFILHESEQQYMLFRIQRDAKIIIQNYKIQTPNSVKCEQLDQEQKQYVEQKCNDFEECKFTNIQRHQLSKFKISNWRRLSVTSVQLSKYVQSVVKVCDVITKIDESSIKNKHPSVIFEVPEIYESQILNLDNQFKTDGYKLEHIQSQKRIILKPY